MLKALTASGKKLFVASSKPEVLSGKLWSILSWIRILPYGRRGFRRDQSEESGCHPVRPRGKNGITDLEKVIMIGDRKHDILGAKEVGVDSVGVLYGYGDREELEAAERTFWRKQFLICRIFYSVV